MKVSQVYSGLFIVGLMLAVVYASNQALNGDQLQTLFRGYMAAHKDIWLNYGNAASVVGNVPGSLSTLLVGVPLFLWDSPWAPMLVIFACNIAALVLFDKVIRQVFDDRARLFFLVLFWLSPWFLYQHMLYNPAYLFFCSALHFYTAFRLKDSGDFWHTFFHVIAIGLVMQLHYSWPLLVLISGYLFVRGILRPNYWAVVAAVIVIAVSLVPYVLEVVNASSQAARPEEFSKQRYIGWGAVHVYPVLKALIYWLRYSSFLFTEKLIAGATFDWITSSENLRLAVMYAYRGLLYAAGLISVVFSFKANVYLFRRVKALFMGGLLGRRGSQTVDASVCDDDWLVLYLGATVVAIFVSAGLSPTVFGYWHLIMLYPFAAINMLIYINHTHLHAPSFVKWVAVIALFSVFVNVVASHDSVKFTYKIPYTKQVELWLIEEGL